MIQPIADNQKFYFQLHVVPHDLVESLLTDFYFRSLEFGRQCRISGAIKTAASTVISETE